MAGRKADTQDEQSWEMTDMKNNFFFRVLALFLLTFGPALAQTAPGIAVTDLAYTERVEEYFAAGKFESTSTLQSGGRIDMASVQTKGSYMEGTSSYIEQRELGGFSADVRSAILRGTTFRLVQGQGFDQGPPKNTEAERAFNAVNSGKIEPRTKHPEVTDIIDRIKKREFSGAEFVLFGTLTDIQFRDQFSPIQGTTSGSQIFSLDVVAEYNLINTKTFEIASAFSAQGSGSETKLISNRGDVLPPNRARVVRDASKSLAQDLFSQLSDQLSLQDSTAGRIRQAPSNAPSPGTGSKPKANEPPKDNGVIRYN